MKKILLILLAVMVVFSIAAAGCKTEAVEEQ